MTKIVRITSFLLVMLMCIAMFASCSNTKKYENALKEAGYTITTTSNDDVEDLNDEAKGEYKVKAQIIANKGLQYVTVTQFATSKQAEKQANELIENGGDLFGALSIKAVGKCVLYGTPDAVKVALGE